MRSPWPGHLRPATRLHGESAPVAPLPLPTSSTPREIPFPPKSNWPSEVPEPILPALARLLRAARQPRCWGGPLPAAGVCPVLSAPLREHAPNYRRAHRRRSPAATPPRRPAVPRRHHAALRAFVTSRRRTAAGRIGSATRASRRSEVPGSTSARSRPDGSACSTGRHRPCRCAAACRRRSRGTPPGSAP